jgi:regulator of protease activity HflC (stomatin/prohibitin superfamily)
MAMFGIRKQDTPPATFRGKVWHSVRRRLPGLILFLLIGIFIAVVLFPYVVVNVPSGHVGVLWKRFAGGTVIDPNKLKKEGLHLILPWNKVFIYDLRIQSENQVYHAISSDGVGLDATINIRYRLQRDFVPALHQVIGPEYMKLLGPEVASRMREVISQYTAEQVYSTDREKVQHLIKQRVQEGLAGRFLESVAPRAYRVPINDALDLYDTLLNNIVLPASIVAAINRKAEQNYVAQEWVYRVEREKLESERKAIEAQGIRDFQQTVSQGISDSYLSWRGIEATLELSKSDNAKVVIIGAGKEGLPIILGNVDAPSPPKAAKPAVPGSSADTGNAGADQASPPPAGPEPTASPKAPN